MKGCNTLAIVLFIASISFSQSVILVSPPNDATVKTESIDFNCDISNPNGIDSAILWTDISSIWEPTSRQKAQGGEYLYDESMQLWMHLNEESGYIQDYSGYGHDGTVNGATFVPAGRIGGAYSFDGNDYISMSSSDFNLPDQTGATIAAWAYPVSGQSSSYGTILFIDRGSSISIRLHLTVNKNRTVSMKARVSGSTLYTVTTTQTLPTDTWTHIAGLIDITNGKMAVYIGGTLSRDQNKNFNATRFENTTSINPCIGGISGSSSYSFKGMIDELALFNRVLSETEIEALYQGASGTEWSPSFTVSSLPSGTFNWNVEAKDPENNSFWAPTDWSFTNSPLTAEYVDPTPPEGGTINTSTATIKLNATNPLASASLHLKKQESGEKIFKISTNSADWNKWGFRYPVTHEFDLVDISTFQVLKRDSELDEWQALPIKTSAEFYNGVEAARLDPIQKIAYVSVAFNTQPEVYLKFVGNSTVTYRGVSLYYDNRKATYSLSIDNWGGDMHAGTNAGVPCQSSTDDNGDKYQAAVWVCRSFNLPVSVAINTRIEDNMAPVWTLIQGEIDANAIEPAVHSCTHPCSDAAYQVLGYTTEILGCRDDLLANLTNIPYGDYIFEFVLPCGFYNSDVSQTSAGEFLLLREWTNSDNPNSINYENWDATYNYYYGAFQTYNYDDEVFENRNPAGRYYAADVAGLNSGFDAVYNSNGIMYAMWHPDRYTNSVIYDDREPIEGVQGSSLMQHLGYVSNRNDVWYVANGWLYNYRRAAEIATVEEVSPMVECGTFDMTIDNSSPPDHFAVLDLYDLENNNTYYYQTTVTDTDDDSVVVPSENFRSFQVFNVNDPEPPVISGATGDVPGTTGEPVTISATITDNMSVTSAKVYYTPVNGTETNTSMTKAPDSDIWIGEVPVDLNNVGVIPYFISAVDIASNTARDPETGDYTITVSDNDPPVANAGSDQSVLTGTLVSFDGSASSDNIGITGYSWDFDASDGIQVDATGVTAEHTYTAAGPYTVTLTVIDNAGLEAQDVVTVTVDAVEIVKGPYLQMGATPNSMVIMWETDLNAGSRVDFGLAAPNEDFVENPTPVTIHEVELTGLSPDTRYYYTVTSDDITSLTYIFSTAPETVRPFRFAAYGDIQRETPVHGDIVQGIISHNPEFVIHTGDIVDDGTVYDQWGPQFFNQAQALICSTAFIPVIGNHEDLGGPPALFKDFFSLPNNEEWYAYTYSNIRFIGLNTEATYSAGSDQYNWLVSELQSNEFNNATWHIVYYHRPAFTASNRHSDEVGVKTHLVPLFEQYGVDLVFSGHSHLYERYCHNGIYYLVIGGGGMVLDQLVTDTQEPIRQVGAEEYHYCIIDVSNDHCDLAVKRLDGSNIDQLTLVRDLEPPVITDATGDIPGTTGDPVTISATITDNIGVSSAAVYYTPIGGSETNIAMTKDSESDLWSGQVPVDLNNTGTIPYHVSAVDGANNTARAPETGDYTITVSDNDPPLADAGQDQQVLIGELVSFDGSASSDNIGVTSYSWDFDVSDGIQVDATGITAEHTYTTANQYTVTLTVTDDAGLTDEGNVIVSVDEAAASMHVDAITVTKVDLEKGFKKGRSEVVILDENGEAVSGATVTGTFSGDLDETVEATTNSDGLAVLETTSSKKGSLKITFCVDDVVHATLTYDAGANVETCDSN